MEFKIHTLYNRERLLRYYMFMTFISKRRRWLWIFIIAMNLFMGGFCIWMNSHIGMEPSILIRAMFIPILSILMLLINLIGPLTAVKRTPAYQAHCSFRFGEEGIEACAEGPKLRENLTMDYSAITKVVEDKEVFYIHLSATQAYILDKSGFEQGDPASFKEFLRSRIEPKRIKY